MDADASKNFLIIAAADDLPFDGYYRDKDEGAAVVKIIAGKEATQRSCHPHRSMAMTET